MRNKTGAIKPILIALAFLFAACGGKTVIDEEHELGATWNRFTPEVFDLTVSNTENYYNIDLSATVDTARYRYSELPVMVILKSPGGEERQFYGAVVLGGKDHATSRLRNYFSFNSKGQHHMEISQVTSQYDLEGVRSITLTVTKAKVDYDL